MSEKAEETITVELEEGDIRLTNLLLDAVARRGQAVGRFNFLPLDTLVALDELSEHYPGLRWVLRKQRGDRYELRVISSKHLEMWSVKGEP